MAAGGLGRAVAISATHPIDTVKTRVQAHRGAGEQTAVDALRGVLAKSGVKGLYAGLDGSIVGQVPSSALAFACYEQVRAALSPLVPPSLHLPFLIANGAFGGLVGTLLVVPSEVVKTRLQTGAYGSAREAAGAILRDGGPAGFYGGCGPQIWRDVPFRAIQLAAFEAMGEALGGAGGGDALLRGVAAGAIAAALTTPLDVVKTRVMAEGPGAYRGTPDALVRIVREEGPAALMRGVGPRVLVIAPMSAIFFFVYEALRALLAA